MPSFEVQPLPFYPFFLATQGTLSKYEKV